MSHCAHVKISREVYLSWMTNDFWLFRKNLERFICYIKFIYRLSAFFQTFIVMLSSRVKFSTLIPLLWGHKFSSGNNFFHFWLMILWDWSFREKQRQFPSPNRMGSDLSSPDSETVMLRSLSLNRQARILMTFISFPHLSKKDKSSFHTWVIERQAGKCSFK